VRVLEPDINSWIKAAVEHARVSKSVRSLLNRRRLLPLITSKSLKNRRRAERQAVNTPIQGTASDIIKLATVEVDRMIRLFDDTRSGCHDPARERSGCHRVAASASLVLNIHDELVYEVADEHLDRIVDVIRTGMERCARLALRDEVPVAIRTGKRFDLMTELPVDHAAESDYARILRGWYLPKLQVRRTGSIAAIVSPCPRAMGHVVVLSTSRTLAAQQGSQWHEMPVDEWIALCTEAQLVAKALDRVLGRKVMLIASDPSSDHTTGPMLHLVPWMEGTRGTSSVPPHLPAHQYVCTTRLLPVCLRQEWTA